MIINQKFIQEFKEEAGRQRDFTNSFWRQLAVIIVSIAIIQVVGPYVIFWGTNIAANQFRWF
ncbi:TPA: hypothetical protein DCR79_02260 [Patescibacteria group bacterium]|nr:hypothetical protein [Patescibacteria group bacterium]